MMFNPHVTRWCYPHCPISAQLCMVHGGPACARVLRMWRKVNLRADRYAQIEVLAERERRSVSQMADMLLERALVGQPDSDVGHETRDVGQEEVPGGTV